jgi:hypothetical protein
MDKKKKYASIDLSIHKSMDNENIESALGPIVSLMRLIKDGESEYWLEEKMPALLAAMALIDDNENGTRVKRAYIDWNGVIDVWSSSL